VLEEENIPVDFVTVTSSGAIIGAAYCAGMRAKELEKMARTVPQDQHVGGHVGPQTPEGIFLHGRALPVVR